MLHIPDHGKFEKYIFCVPFGIFLGHVVCKQGLILDLRNIVVIVNLETTRNFKQSCTTLGNKRYYSEFIKAYAQIIVPMKKPLKKDATFCCEEECQCSLDVLKENMVTASILVFPAWKNEFHVHVDVGLCYIVSTTSPRRVPGV